MTSIQNREEVEIHDVAAGRRTSWNVIVVLAFGHLAGDVYSVLLMPLVADFQEAFALSVTAVTVLVNVGSLSNSMLQPVAGHFLEGFDQKRVFALGLVVAAVFSSLLGVWQAVPYVFADWLGIVRGRGADVVGAPVSTRGLPYRGYLLALALVPLVQVHHPFRDVQKWYAVMGAAFIPLLAMVLLVLNGRRSWIGARHVNGMLSTIVLVVAVLLFLAAAVYEIRGKL